MTRKNTTPYCRERRAFFVASFLLLSLFGSYIYFVSASVVHVIAYKEIDREIAQVQSRIGDLESAYIAAKQTITEETLERQGFVAAPDQRVYIQKTTTGIVLAVNNEN